MKILKIPISFDWDAGNQKKSVKKHRVTNEESEELFFDPHKRVVGEGVVIKNKERYMLVGRTKRQRSLIVVFTIRKNKIRIISARDLNKKERKWLI